LSGEQVEITIVVVVDPVRLSAVGVEHHDAKLRCDFYESNAAVVAEDEVASRHAFGP